MQYVIHNQILSIPCDRYWHTKERKNSLVRKKINVMVEKNRNSGCMQEAGYSITVAALMGYITI